MQSVLLCFANLLKLLKCYRKLTFVFACFGALLFMFALFFREVSLNYCSLRVRQSDNTWQGSSMLLLHWQKVRDPLQKRKKREKAFSYKTDSQVLHECTSLHVGMQSLVGTPFFQGFALLLHASKRVFHYLESFPFYIAYAPFLLSSDYLWGVWEVTQLSLQPPHEG